MTDREQIEAFTGDILGVVDRYRAEFNLPNASAIGALEIVKASMLKGMLEDVDGDDDGETLVE